ncbi:MAG: hypothetical protein GXC76_04395 [Rhodanobacteraceae bacterium]|nr:hypothetical protein [Rhodanobacteraceae bacterium]
MTHAFFGAFLLLMAGASVAQPDGFPASAADAARQAERFIARHGFTDAGHPADLPVENVSLYDMLRSRAELVAQRKGSLKSEAACVRSDEVRYSVLFQSTQHPQDYFFVAFNPDAAPYVGHQPVSRTPDCKPVAEAR